MDLLGVSDTTLRAPTARTVPVDVAVDVCVPVDVRKNRPRGCLKKKDLQAAADISPGAISKLGRNENVTTLVLMKICNALKCDIGDIMEIIPEEPKGGDGDE